MPVRAQVPEQVQVQVPQRKPRPAQEMLGQAPVQVQVQLLSVLAPEWAQALACHRNLLRSRQQVSKCQCASRGQSRF
jgi:hypothetical protein